MPAANSGSDGSKALCQGWHMLVMYGAESSPNSSRGPATAPGPQDRTWASQEMALMPARERWGGSQAGYPGLPT